MTWALFVTILLIHLAAAVSPGPSFVVSVRTAASAGFNVAAGLALGFGCGAVLWAFAAMTGLAVLFELMPVLLTSLKFGGAAVLIFIAVTMWRHANDPIETAATGLSHPTTFGAAVRLGLVTFATNPKPALFFGAVFVGLVPADTPLIWRAAILAGVFINEVSWYLIVARIFSRQIARDQYLRLKASIDRTFGTVIALLGLKIALT